MFKEVNGSHEIYSANFPTLTYKLFHENPNSYEMNRLIFEMNAFMRENKYCLSWNLPNENGTKAFFSNFKNKDEYIKKAIELEKKIHAQMDYYVTMIQKQKEEIGLIRMDTKDYSYGEEDLIKIEIAFAKVKSIKESSKDFYKNIEKRKNND